MGIEVGDLLKMLGEKDENSVAETTFGEALMYFARSIFKFGNSCKNAKVDPVDAKTEIIKLLNKKPELEPYIMMAFNAGLNHGSVLTINSKITDGSAKQALMTIMYGKPHEAAGLLNLQTHLIEMANNMEVYPAFKEATEILSDFSSDD